MVPRSVIVYGGSPVSIHWGSAIATGVAAFLYAAVAIPCLSAYDRWKNDPNRDRSYRPNLFGMWVPDLWQTRIIRAFKVSLLLLFVLGLAIDWQIMHPATTDDGALIIPVEPPHQKGE
jgi:hypothetical protein